jgi:hypothetical protein
VAKNIDEDYPAGELIERRILTRVHSEVHSEVQGGGSGHEPQRELMPGGGVTTLQQTGDDLLQTYRSQMHDIPEEFWGKIPQDLRERKSGSAHLSAVPPSVLADG